MKDKALAYLRKNPLLHMEMIEPLRLNSADILYAEPDGVLIKEQNSSAYMISVDHFETGQKLLNSLLKCNLIVAHQAYMADYISKRFGLTTKFECVQAVYMNKINLDLKEELEIRKLDLNQMGAVLEHYDKLSSTEIGVLLKNGNLFGGYKNGKLIGFIGNHLEGSIGVLEVFPQYRRLGYGAALESFMVNRMLKKELIPFAQIEINNDKSISLQKKLGFKISEGRLYWMF